WALQRPGIGELRFDRSVRCAGLDAQSRRLVPALTGGSRGASGLPLQAVFGGSRRPRNEGHWRGAVSTDAAKIRRERLTAAVVRVERDALVETDLSTCRT